ncbi:hypothetical protein [Bacillus altitudinis]|uniref:hypothetical protein n=1 Tax=Bacillus altitudinis TaxID=293387 RepID=UPI0011A3AB94|nr:hypothetical protein [Bacillus altitudinis]
MSFTFDASSFITGITNASRNALESAAQALGDSGDDLGRIAQNIAPIDKGTLRASIKKNYKLAKGKAVVDVSLRAVEGGFNYAIWTHEMDYNLGPASQAAGGIDGYEVGNKYLERPLKGNAEKYVRWIAEGVHRGLS